MERPPRAPRTSETIASATSPAKRESRFQRRWWVLDCAEPSSKLAFPEGMKSEPVLATVRKLVAEVCALSSDTIRAEAHLQEYRVDSLRAMEIVAAIEDEYEITLEEDALKGVRTVAQLVQSVEQRLAATGRTP
jgi:acyl carrier protein